MKKTFMLAFFALAVAALSAQSIELGDFPIGKWIDNNYGAIWEFESNSIRIVDESGNVYYDFEGKTIVDFKIAPSTSGLELSFRCEETGKNYKFVKGLTNLNLDMVIDTDSGIHYEVELPKR